MSFEIENGVLKKYIPEENETTVTLPASVTSIATSAFDDCSVLKEIKVDINNTEYSDIDGILFNKDKTELLRYPIGKKESRYEIPASVTSIGDSAFLGCSGLKEITIPNSVTNIGIEAFLDCLGL